MNKFISLSLAGLLILLLLLVRAFEESLFYDPLLNYFKGDYKNLPIPQMENAKLYLNVVFRFAINSLISLGILWFIFRDKDIVKLSTLLFVIVFLLLFFAFVFIIQTATTSTDPWALFYVRRFLIQPLLLLLLLPAFYFQKQKIR